MECMFSKSAKLAMLLGTLIWMALPVLAFLGMSATELAGLFLLSEILFYGGAVAIGASWRPAFLKAKADPSPVT